MGTKKTYHLQAFIDGEECAFVCTSDKHIAINVVVALMCDDNVTSVTFDEVIDCECSC